MIVLISYTAVYLRLVIVPTVLSAHGIVRLHCTGADDLSIVVRWVVMIFYSIT